MQHVKRWITALIIAPLVVWILLRGSTLVLAALISVVAIFSLREYLTIIFGNDDGPISNTIKTISYTIAMALVVGATLGAWQVMFLILSLNLAALAGFVLFRFAAQPRVFDIISKQVLGIVYIPVSLSLLVFIRELEGGVFWIIWLLIVIFANDTGAFYAGTYKGRHKLSPNISPNKTIEGSFGGILAAVTAGFIFCLIFFRDPALAFLTLPCSLVMALAGQVGDLFESAMKRVSSIKDSGRILPGHGGMLDRIDGLLMAVPVLYVYLVFVI
ncbi:phosphatidate cytidylyltransferase [Desulfospira joergensenii]|uniref:phosphatidate cytidylyltransferase n=1 Tax=Desulfospira joergensenii TaxID=53329 RepID=UPI0003B70261|nr:phosphatidate cytidylyltransferase [Desulfospira joergensenii]